MWRSARALIESAATTPLLRGGVNAGPSKIELALSHKVPKMPTRIDEQEVDPRTVLEFRGQTLVTVADGDAIEGRMLHIFTDLAPAQEYLRAGESPSAEQAASSGGSTPRFSPGPPTKFTCSHCPI